MMNRILEAFGNAKTQLNTNSSRFGQYLSLSFDQSSTIQTARLKTYLLEKTRVVKQGDGEHNYHVFNYMFAGTPISLFVVGGGFSMIA